MMGKNSMFIPRKIKVGYQTRTDTYTGKLAYVIYYDNKNVLRKEASWNSWRDKKIDPDELDNVPLAGFVLNKKVGGYKSGWDFRQAYVRVYDPRGFEFEISVPNLLYILEHSSSIKGKGLEGEFVYAWEGTELVLLPVDAPEYAELKQLNEQRFKNETIKAKELKIGATYLHKDNSTWVYMGRFDHYERGYTCGDQWFSNWEKASKYALAHGKTKEVRTYYTLDRRPDVEWGAYGTSKKKHCFYCRESNEFLWPNSLSGLLIDTLSEEPAADYADIFEKLESSPCYSPPDKSKDTPCLVTLDEFRAEMDSSWWEHKFRAKEASGVVTIYKVKGGKGLDTLFIVSVNGDYDVRSYFPCKATGNLYKPYEMIPAPLEEIYNKFTFVKTKQYLANGKYYGTVWT